MVAADIHRKFTLFPTHKTAHLVQLSFSLLLSSSDFPILSQSSSHPYYDIQFLLLCLIQNHQCSSVTVSVLLLLSQTVILLYHLVMKNYNGD